MKKIILKISFGILLVGALLVNISIQNSKVNDGELLLANIGAFAMADGEGLPADCEAVWENVTCSSGGKSYTYAKKI